MLFARFPDLRFVLTTRPVEDWLASIFRLYPQYPVFGRPTVALAAIQWHGFLSAEVRDHQILEIGIAADRRAKLTRSFLNHEKNVVAFFDGTDSSRFARLPLDQSDKWPIIERLTGRKAPNAPYPWSNRAATER